MHHRPSLIMLIASLLAGFVTAAPARADVSLVKAFVRCSNEFFDVIRSERATIGQVSIGTFETGGEGPPGSEVVFSKPLTEFGLSFTKYRQFPTHSVRDHHFWTWGLVVAAKPRNVAWALDPYMKREGISRQGIHPNSPDQVMDWVAGIGAEKVISQSGVGWRRLMISPLDGGKSSLVTCRVMSDDYPGFRGVPDATDLFRLP